MEDASISRLRVVVRCRPIVNDDFQQVKKAGRIGITPERCVRMKADGQTIELLKQSVICPSEVYQRVAYRYDHTFDAHDSQEHVYKLSIKDMITSFLRDGYNCTCMAYGQVSTLINIEVIDNTNVLYLK